MKKKLTSGLALTALLLSFLFLARNSVAQSALQSAFSAMQATETVTEPQPGTIVRQITYHGSDPLAVGDPLRNGAVTPKHNAGPPLTQQLSYDQNCQNEACQRALQRWNSNTSWEQDRASGLSLGWGVSQ